MPKEYHIDQRLSLYYTIFSKKKKPLFQSGSFGQEDPFTLTWTFELLANRKCRKLAGVDKNDFNRVATKAVALVKRAFSKPREPLLSFSLGAPPRVGAKSIPLEHVFPLLRCVQLFRALEREKTNIVSAKSDTLSECAKMLTEEVKPYFCDRLHQHISLFTIRDGSFDIAELVFSLEALFLCADDPRNISPDLVDRVFEIVGEAQKRNAYWRPLKPFVTTPQGHALLPLSVEIANSLLRICGMRSKGGSRPTYYSRHVHLFQQYAAWVLPRLTRGRALNKSGSKFKFAGWHSEHVHVPQKIHPWETSQVLLFLMHHRAFLEQHIADKTLELSGLQVNRPKRNSKKYETEVSMRDHLKNFEPLPSAVNGAGTIESCYDVYGRIVKHYLSPRGVGNKKLLDLSRAHYSFLLYGPPGTGKSTVAEEVAKALNWDLITITPSDFISQGEAQVEARAKAIFRTLEKQTDKVILLDEIDRMILDRDSGLYSEQDDIFQFMTPSMLVKLKDLRSRKRVIFIIATNYEERIDAAVKRKGRIDDRFMIGPPDRGQRKEILSKAVCDALEAKLRKFSKYGSDESPSKEKRQAKLEQYTDVLETQKAFETTLNKTVLMTYGELKRLTETAMEALASDNLEHNSKADIAKRMSMLADCFSEELKCPEQSTIRLASYLNRFLDENGEVTAGYQEPFMEFLALVYLKAESNADFERADEEDVLKRVHERLKKRGTDVEAELKEIIQEQFVFNKIKGNMKAYNLLTKS